MTSYWTLQPAKNPFSIAIEEYSDFTDANSLLRDPGTFVAGLFLYPIQCVVLLISVLLWPYGWLFVFADILWQLIVYNAERLRSAQNSLAAIAIG